MKTGTAIYKSAFPGVADESLRRGEWIAGGEPGSRTRHCASTVVCPGARMRRFAIIGLLALVSSAAHAADTSWVEESNRNAQLLLDINVRYGPEGAASTGIEGHDSEIFDLKPRVNERQMADLEAAAKELEARRAQTRDPRVIQDLDILIGAARDQVRSTQLS